MKDEDTDKKPDVDDDNMKLQEDGSQENRNIFLEGDNLQVVTQIEETNNEGLFLGHTIREAIEKRLCLTCVNVIPEISHCIIKHTQTSEGARA